MARITTRRSNSLNLMEDIVQLAEDHNTSSHLYADDTQLYASCRSEDFNDVRTRLSNCITDVA